MKICLRLVHRTMECSRLLQQNWFNDAEENREMGVLRRQGFARFDQVLIFRLLVG